MQRCKGVEWGTGGRITGYKLSKVEDARLDRCPSVGYATQVVGRAGTKGALTILLPLHEVWASAHGRFHVVFTKEEGQLPHLVLLWGTVVFPVSTKPAPTWSPCIMMIMKTRAWSTKLHIHRTETVSR